MKKFTLLFLIATLLFSCENTKEVDLEVPYKDKLISVTFLEEGSSSIELALTRTSPGISPEVFDVSYIKDASVVLHTPNQSYTLVFDETDQLYRTTMPAEVFTSGSSYSISAEQKGEKVTGITKIPGTATPLTSIKLDSSLQDGGYVYLAKITCGIKEPGAFNVIVSAFMVYSDSSRSPMIATTYLAQPVARLKTGQQTTREFKSNLSSEFIYPVRAEVILMLCDDPYALYNNSVQGIDFGGPFGEPVITYSNMSNHIGAIGSYRYLPAVSVPVK